MKRGSSFTLKFSDNVERITKNLVAEVAKVDQVLRQRMEIATEIVYKTASARRPKISKSQQKAMGRSAKAYRVSDPNAKLGVPVDTGILQASIKKKITKQGNKLVGSIGTSNKYAVYMEYGTSRIAPRPFIRPAINENREAIRKVFSKENKK